MFTGIALDQQIDVELGDRLKNGAVTTIYSGTATPSSSTGINGDLYFKYGN